MSTAYGIIIRHGGSIEVESKEGKGATFNLSIPINSGSTQQKPSAKPVTQGDNGKQALCPCSR